MEIKTSYKLRIEDHSTQKHIVLEPPRESLEEVLVDYDFLNRNRVNNVVTVSILMRREVIVPPSESASLLEMYPDLKGNADSTIQLTSDWAPISGKELTKLRNSIELSKLLMAHVSKAVEDIKCSEQTVDKS